jgi:hypothetical protein
MYIYLFLWPPRQPFTFRPTLSLLYGSTWQPGAFTHSILLTMVNLIHVSSYPGSIVFAFALVNTHSTPVQLIRSADVESKHVSDAPDMCR